MDERLNLPPEHLRVHVVLVAQLAALPGKRLGFVVAPERAQREPGAGGKRSRPALTFEEVTEPLKMADGLLLVARERRHRGHHPVDVPVVAGKLVLSLGRLLGKRESLVEAAEHSEYQARHPSVLPRKLVLGWREAHH
ncbi:MAG TPA: hypothetical protein VF895_02440 [Gaiellaceae bacterium]